MALIVQKFGATCLASPERIKAVARHVARWRLMGHDLVVVPSAMPGETNRLIALANALSHHPNPRELDVVAATGEQVSIGLLAIALEAEGVRARSYTGTQARLLTDSAFNEASILRIENASLHRDLADGFVVVVAGFQGVDERGNITTLGRGGGDVSAVALAAALQAEECQIYSEADGVYTTDPAVVPEARKLKRITFEEMLEMASLGSRVLQIRAVEFAGKHKVKLRVLSGAFNDADGTLITVDDDFNMEKPIISGITFNRDEAKVTVLGVPDRPGIAYQVLGPIADARLDVDMIIQNQGQDGATDLTFTVHRSAYAQVREIMERVAAHIGARQVIGDKGVCKVSAVGVGMRSHPGVASKMFRTLAEEGINIQMISTSEIKISVVIDEKYLELAVRVLHRAFELD